MTQWNALARLDGVAQAELVTRGELSREELLDACAERVAALNPLLRAITALDVEGARARPQGDGPFAGVPFLVKDLTPYPGLPWTAGSRLFASNVAAEPTPYSARIDAAGLVTIGKSATSEFGLLGSTETLLHGATLNPWDLSRSAAGSSGGAAAAVAAGLVPLAHASDGGGSIRIPASVCGLFGFKPSRGRCVPAAPGGGAFAALVSEHCVSRSVRDSALFLAQTEDRDAPLPPLGHVERALDRPLRVAVWTRSDRGCAPEPAIRAAHEEAVALCVALGHHVEAIEPPRYDAQALGDAFFLGAGAMVAGALAMVTQALGRAPAPEVLEPFSRALAEAFVARGPAALEEAGRVFAAAAASYVDALADYDVALTPTLAVEPWPLGHLSPVLPADELLARTARAVGYTPIHNVAGCPAMSVPLHVSAAGVPIGAHFAAAPGADARLLGLAYQLEEARPWRDRWAPWSYPAMHDA
ncbi:MAG: amidase family protein [Nannocystaceae bacterium]